MLTYLLPTAYWSLYGACMWAIQYTLQSSPNLALVCGLMFLPVVFGGVIGIDLYMRFVSRKSRWRRMRDGGMNVCTQCGYDLKGLEAQATHCPECGFELGELSELGPALHKA